MSLEGQMVFSSFGESLLPARILVPLVVVVLVV